MATISLVAAGIVAPTTATAQEQYYYVVNKRTNMVAEVFAHSLDEGAWVALWPNYGGDSEQFEKVDKGGDDWFWLVAKHSGKCLSRTRDKTSTAVVQSDCYVPSKPWFGSDTRQLWRVRQVHKTAAECPNRNQCFAAFRTVLDNWYISNCLDAANAKAPTPPAQGTEPFRVR
ncbi:RICIN domain-containing protein [Streptomyces sp. NPDC058304]|uniref:RICIN domain-containing protein n=1 Tax=Streptomyces sp. NPDC058304 TaxID=3346437 RepID=UPI0036E43351